MKRDYLEKILEIGTFLCFSLLVINVLFQISTRLLFPDFAKVWTEELSRLLFVYSISFAAPLALKKQEYVNVDLFIEKFSGKAKTIIEVILNTLTFLLFVMVFYASTQFVKLGVNQQSVTMGHKMFWAYLSIPMMIILIIVYVIAAHRNFLKKKRGGN